MSAQPITRSARRQELRHFNLALSDGLANNGTVDASLKRNTAYIKRVRGSLHLGEAQEALVKEVDSLALDKYMPELVQACAEGAQKVKTATEVWNAVEVISAIHRRFGKDVFSLPLSSQLVNNLKPTPPAKTQASAETREKEEQARISRQRPLLRLFGELEAVAVFGHLSKPGQETVSILKDLLHDRENISNTIALAVGFVKSLGAVYLPLNDPQPGQNPEETLIPPNIQENCQKILKSYHSALSTRATGDHLNLLQTEQRNNEAYIRSGEIFDDRQAAFDRQAKNAEKLWTGLVNLSEVLNLPVPEQPSLPTTNVVSSLIHRDQGSSSIGADGEEIYSSTSLWADEQEKRFYEDIADLRDEVPPALLGISAKDESLKEEIGKVEPVEDSTLPEDLGEEVIDEIPPDVDETEEDTRKQNDALAAIEQSAEPLASGPAARLSELFLRLPECASKEGIDQIAVDFAFINSKASRNRLIKFIADVPRARLDLLPFYARLVAILSRYMPDILAGILAVIDDDIRYLQKRKQLEMRDVRYEALHMLSELVKFGIVPVHTTLHAFKVFIDDLARYNVDSVCILLENCGRFALRQASTGPRMQILVISVHVLPLEAELGQLDTLIRKKAAQHLTPNQVAMLDSALVQCIPPERPAVVPKVRSTMHLFIHSVMYNMLTRQNYDKVYKILRKLAWDDPAVLHTLHNAFTKIWKAKYSNISLFALMLYDLAKLHPLFAVNVVDQVLEDIRVGLERNNFRDNQKRVASVRYLAEIYNFQTVDGKLIFDTLWLLVTFGHPEGRPMPDAMSAIDMPEDWFRIRLVCTLLEATYVHLDHGSSRTKIDSFLLFFQVYIKCKAPPPMDVDFMIHDTFEAIRPKMGLASTFGEAAAAFDELTSKDVPENNGDHDMPSDNDEATSRSRLLVEDESQSDSDTEQQDQPFEENSEQVVAPVSRQTMSLEEEEEFSREFARMMTESTNERKTMRSGLGDVSLPTLKRDRASAPAPIDSDNMVFTLLTKKGNKAQTKSLEIPKAASIALQTVSQQEIDKREQQMVKQLVLRQEARRQDEAAASEKQVGAAASDQWLRVKACFGNSSLENTTSNTAQCLVGFNAKEDVKVFPGASSGLFKPFDHGASNIHGDTGLEGVEGLPAKTDARVQPRVTKSRAIDGMRQAAAECLTKYKKLTICVTGPITNFAIFLLAYPKLVEQAVEEVLFMGGALEERGNSNRNRTAEWNVFCDPHALKIVLDRCPCPLRLFPLDITHQAILRSAVEMPRLREKQSTIRTVLSTTADFFNSTYSSVFGFRAGPPCHDLLTIAFVCRPEIFEGKSSGLSVLLDGEDVGRIERASTGKQVWIAERLNLDALWDTFFAALEQAER